MGKADRANVLFPSLGRKLRSWDNTYLGSALLSGTADAVHPARSVYSSQPPSLITANIFTMPGNFFFHFGM